MLRVRLVMTVNEDDGSAAVREFVDALTLNGMRDWVYAVEVIETDEVVGYYNGFGVEVDLDALIAQQNTELEERDPEEIVLPPAPDLDVTVDFTQRKSDEDLVELAEELNK